MESSVKLYFEEALIEKLEARMILQSDIRKAILEARDTGQRLFNPGTGRYLTSYRPRNVTFWVEYAPYEKGYFIHNAYSHRMAAEITGRIKQNGGEANGQL